MICTGLWRLFLVESRNIRYQGAVFGSRFWDRRSEHPGRASLQGRGSSKACSRSVCRLQTVGWTGRMDRVEVAGCYEFRGRFCQEPAEIDSIEPVQLVPASACLDLGIIQLGKSRVVGGLELFLSHCAELHPLSLGVGPAARVSEDRVSDQRTFEVIVAA